MKHAAPTPGKEFPAGRKERLNDAAVWATGLSPLGGSRDMNQENKDADRSNTS